MYKPITFRIEQNHDENLLHLRSLHVSRISSDVKKFQRKRLPCCKTTTNYTTFEQYTPLDFNIKFIIKFYKYFKINLRFVSPCIIITIQINHQPDAAIFQFIILTFIYSSTCFGRSPAHYQELGNCCIWLVIYLNFKITFIFGKNY